MCLDALDIAVDSSVPAPSDDCSVNASSQSSHVETLADAFSCWFGTYRLFLL